jgi:hypothetical protein
MYQRRKKWLNAQTVETLLSLMTSSAKSAALGYREINHPRQNKNLRISYRLAWAPGRRYDGSSQLPSAS